MLTGVVTPFWRQSDDFGHFPSQSRGWHQTSMRVESLLLSRDAARACAAGKLAPVIEKLYSASWRVQRIASLYEELTNTRDKLSSLHSFVTFSQSPASRASMRS